MKLELWPIKVLISRHFAVVKKLTNMADYSKLERSAEDTGNDGRTLKLAHRLPTRQDAGKRTNTVTVILAHLFGGIA